MKVEHEKLLTDLRTDSAANRVLDICQNVILDQKHLNVKGIYLSGGRVIDHILGKRSSKDIDVFVVVKPDKNKNEKAMKELNQKLANLFVAELIEKSRPFTKKRAYNFLVHDPVASFYVYDFIGSQIHPKIQVIYYYTPHQYPRFDLQACEIFYDQEQVDGSGLTNFYIAEDSVRAITVNTVKRCIKYADRGVEIHKEYLSKLADWLNTRYEISLEQISTNDIKRFNNGMLRFLVTLLHYHPNYASYLNPRFLANLATIGVEPLNVIDTEHQLKRFDAIIPSHI